MTFTDSQMDSQNLGIILGNKSFQRLKLSKNVNNEKVLQSKLKN